MQASIICHPLLSFLEWVRQSDKHGEAQSGAAEHPETKMDQNASMRLGKLLLSCKVSYLLPTVARWDCKITDCLSAESHHDEMIIKRKCHPLVQINELRDDE